MSRCFDTNIAPDIKTVSNGFINYLKIFRSGRKSMTLEEATRTGFHAWKNLSNPTKNKYRRMGPSQLRGVCKKKRASAVKAFKRYFKRKGKCKPGSNKKRSQKIKGKPCRCKKAKGKPKPKKDPCKTDSNSEKGSDSDASNESEPQSDSSTGSRCGQQTNPSDPRKCRCSRTPMVSRPVSNANEMYLQAQPKCLPHDMWELMSDDEQIRFLKWAESIKED